MSMPTWVVRCSHCGQHVRVESVAYDNACPLCANVLPPTDLSKMSLPSRPSTAGTTTESMPLPCPVDHQWVPYDAPDCTCKKEDNKPPDQSPVETPVMEAELVDDGQGVDLGDVRLGSESE